MVQVAATHQSRIQYPIHVHEYKRHPKELHECLLKFPALSLVGKSLADKKYNVKLYGGSLLFVGPEHYECIVEHLCTSGVTFSDGRRLFLAGHGQPLSNVHLHSQHVLFGDDFRSAMEDARGIVKTIRNCKVKNETLLHVHVDGSPNLLTSDYLLPGVFRLAHRDASGLGSSVAAPLADDDACLNAIFMSGCV